MGYEVTLLSPRRQLDEQSSGATHESSMVVAQVTCMGVLEAMGSIEKGNDGSLVKMSVGDGKFWEPRMSAASYNLHETSFGMEQIYLDDQRDVSYDVTCKVSMAVCKSTPDSLCDAVTNSEVISFGDAFDGDINIPSSRRRRLGSCKGHDDTNYGDDDDDDSMIEHEHRRDHYWHSYYWSWQTKHDCEPHYDDDDDTSSYEKWSPPTVRGTIIADKVMNCYLCP